MFSSQVIGDVEKEFRGIVGATEDMLVNFAWRPDHIIITSEIINFFKRGIDDQIVAFLKKYRFIKLENCDFLFGCDHTSEIINVSVCANAYSGYNEVIDQCLWARECCVEDIGNWKRVRVVGDITVDQIHEMSDVLFYLDMTPERRLLGLGDIEFSDIERIKRIISFENRLVGSIINEFYVKRDRNKFIDMLIEAGYEEWI